MNWETIETVPMDTSVITYGPKRGIEYHVLSVFYDDEDDYDNFNEDGEYIGNGATYIGRALYNNNSDFNFYDLTHWTTLPELPEALK
jgi:hypothetical protein